MTGSGVSRRPERFGGSVADDERDALRRTLEAFEARVREDTFDSEPGSAKKAELEAALERMRDETKELEVIDPDQMVKLDAYSAAPAR